MEHKLLFLYLPFYGHKTILSGGSGETFLLGVTQLTLFEMVCHGTTFGIIAVTLVVGNMRELAAGGISWCHYPMNVGGLVLLIRFTNYCMLSAG